MVPNRGRTPRFYATLTHYGEDGAHCIHISGFTNGQYETFDNCDSTLRFASPEEWIDYARHEIARGYELKVTFRTPLSPTERS